MRKLVLAGAVLVLTVATSPIAAQGGSWVGSLGGGVTLPVGNAGDAMKTGFHGAATMGYHPAGSKISWLLDASFHRHSDKSIADSHDNIFVAMARANYATSSTLYLLGGVGILRNEFKENGVSPTITSTHSALAFTGGAGYGFGKSLFLEGRIIYASTDGGSTMLIPVTLGFRF